MKVVGIGVDLVDMQRFIDARYFERAVEFFLMPSEIEEMHKSRDKVQFAASRFAAKEAVIKAFPGMLQYHDIQIVKKGDKIGVQFEHANLSHSVFLSIAHELNWAIASVILCV